MVWGIIGFIIGYFVSRYLHDKTFKDKFWQSFKNWLRSLKDKDKQLP